MERGFSQHNNDLSEVLFSLRSLLTIAAIRRGRFVILSGSEGALQL